MVKPTARRSIWEQAPASEVTGQPESSLDWGGAAAVEPQAPAAVPVIEQLRLAEKKQRDRSWERENRTLLFRGVPHGLHEEIKQVAVELQVRTSDVARAFLEYGLLCHQRGELQVTPVLSQYRLTLFPTGDGWGNFPSEHNRYCVYFDGSQLHSNGLVQQRWWDWRNTFSIIAHFCQARCGCEWQNRCSPEPLSDGLVTV